MLCNVGHQLKNLNIKTSTKSILLVSETIIIHVN
jgi:hypothetical protein